MPPVVVNSMNARAFPSGDQDPNASWSGVFVTRCTGPPSRGMTYMSRDPRPRQEWNATSRPSGETTGAKSSLGSVVRRSGMPVASDIR